MSRKLELGPLLVSAQIWDRLGISKSGKFKATWAGDGSKEPQPAMKWGGSEGQWETLQPTGPLFPCRMWRPGRALGSRWEEFMRVGRVSRAVVKLLSRWNFTDVLL